MGVELRKLKGGLLRLPYNDRGAAAALSSVNRRTQHCHHRLYGVRFLTDCARLNNYTYVLQRSRWSVDVTQECRLNTYTYVCVNRLCLRGTVRPIAGLLRTRFTNRRAEAHGGMPLCGSSGGSGTSSRNCRRSSGRCRIHYTDTGAQVSELRT